MMDYLTIDQTMQYLQGRMPAPFEYPQLAQLCRRGKLKPFFAYDGYIKLVHQPNYFNFDDIYFSGYLINTLTIGIITSNATMELGEAFIHEACITEDFECLTSFDLEDKPIMFINDLIDDLKEDEIYCHTVNRSDLLFDRYQVENTPTETSVNNKILHIAQWGEDEKIGIIKDLLPLEQEKKIKKLQSTIDNQAEQITELKAQLASIEQAGKDTQSDTPANNDLLTAIYDDSKPYLYAPELHNAIEVWKLIYHDNLTSQHLTTHSDKFESAIKRLGITFANNAPKDRLKQITTPQQQKEKTKPKNS